MRIKSKTYYGENGMEYIAVDTNTQMMSFDYMVQLDGRKYIKYEHVEFLNHVPSDPAMRASNFWEPSSSNWWERSAWERLKHWIFLIHLVDKKTITPQDA